jgi:hypothetical protein
MERPFRAKVKIKLMLRPTVSRPFLSCCQAPSGAQEYIFTVVRHFWVYYCGSSSLTRGRVSRLQLILTSPAKLLLNSNPAGLMTIRYCLKMRDSPTGRARFPYLYPAGPVTPPASGFLFVTSYNSQSYGGGIRTRLFVSVGMTM